MKYNQDLFNTDIYLAEGTPPLEDKVVRNRRTRNSKYSEIVFYQQMFFGSYLSKEREEDLSTLLSVEEFWFYQNSLIPDNLKGYLKLLRRGKKFLRLYHENHFSPFGRRRRNLALSIAYMRKYIYLYVKYTFFKYFWR